MGTAATQANALGGLAELAIDTSRCPSPRGLTIVIGPADEDCAVIEENGRVIAYVWVEVHTRSQVRVTIRAPKTVRLLRWSLFVDLLREIRAAALRGLGA